MVKTFQTAHNSVTRYRQAHYIITVWRKNKKVAFEQLQADN